MVFRTGWNLPPGVTDRMIDEAAQGPEPEEFPAEVGTELWAEQQRAKRDQIKWCSICGGPYTGWGNNARPVNSGMCCNDCNWMEVVPARLAGFWEKPQ